MADTYYSLNIHCIFSTKDRHPWITGELEERLPSYMAGILRKYEVKPLCVGGTSDHVHVLMSLPTTITIAKAVQLLKGGSSKWIHETFPKQKGFGWQEGYSAFSVSASLVRDVINYVRNQKEHHRKRTFQEEYVSFLKKHGVDHNAKYLWG